jgi:hypothetical protein
MNGKNWQELDFKVASDYTHGSPEDHRTRLRQLIGIPTFLPGEKSEVQEPKRNRQTHHSKTSKRRNLPSYLQQDEG